MNVLSHWHKQYTVKARLLLYYLIRSHTIHIPSKLYYQILPQKNYYHNVSETIPIILLQSPYLYTVTEYYQFTLIIKILSYYDNHTIKIILQSFYHYNLTLTLSSYCSYHVLKIPLRSHYPHNFNVTPKMKYPCQNIDLILQSHYECTNMVIS